MSKKTSLETSNSISSDYDNEQDALSIATSECSQSNQIILAEDDQQGNHPTFGSIAVANSTDIHFGNKTYYQGPVTIKQVLYAGSKNSDTVSETFVTDNPGFIPDQFGAKVKDENDKENDSQKETHQRKGGLSLRSWSRQHLILISSLAAVLLLSLITLLAVVLTRHQHGTGDNVPQYPKDSSEQDKGIPPEYPVDSDPKSTLTNEFRLISRKEWLAAPATDGVEVLKLPVPYVIIMHTASESCWTDGICKVMVRDIQRFHAQGRNWSDIGYSFLVGGDGNAYEGRGWHGVGAQVYGYNRVCIGIAFIGTFNEVLPPRRQMQAAKEIIKIGLEIGAISHNYKLLTARQLQTTQSPGEALYKHIKGWDHWSPNP